MKRSILFVASLLLFSLTATAQPYTIQQYLNIKSASSPTFAPNGKQIAYLTNATGTSQVWVVDVAGGKPTQLTFFEDNIGFVKWLPDGEGIVFGKARGGDENTQFFWMQSDGTGIEPLTNAPAVRHNFGDVSKDGKWIYFSSNKRNRNFFDVYRLNLESEKEELLYQHDGSNSFEAVNDAGTKIIISRSGIEKSLDNDLYLIDLKTKGETHLTPHNDASEFGNTAFLADSILLTTNDGTEFEGLAQLRKKNAATDDWSAANRELTRITNVTPGDIGGVVLDDDGGEMAYTVNDEGFSRLFVRRIERGGKPLVSSVALRPGRIELPGKGIVGGVTFSRDGSKLAFSYSSSTQNGNIWIYDRTTMKLARLTSSDSAGIDAKSFVEPELIKFKTFDGKEIPAWYYKPKFELITREKSSSSKEISRRTVSFEKGFPVIVSVHGGPEGQSRPGFNPLFQYYLSRGYAILDPNVRGSTGYGKTYSHLDDVERREDSVKDLAAAHEKRTKTRCA